MHLNKISMAIIGLSSMGYAHVYQGTGSEDFWLWIALFALGIIGIAILFVTSYQANKKQILLQSMLDKQLEMEKNQNLLLTNMSENIYNIAKQAFQKNDPIIEKTPEPPKKKETMLENAEMRLLDVTNDLLDFLRLKSKKIEIVNEAFNINNVLNELSGSICSQFSGSQVELIFDIDKNVPRHLIGDSLHLGQTLKSILEYMMEQVDADEVRLGISMFDTFEEKVELQFHLSDTGKGMDADTLDNLFVPYYNENTNRYVGLGLFVAHELVEMMGGKISVRSIEGKGSTFTLSLPFDVPNKADQRRYRLPEKALIEKKVLIVDSNANSALAVKKMFAYFRHDVKIVSQEEFGKSIPNVTPFDIVILNEELFSVRLVEYLNKIKMEKELKVVGLNSLLQSNENTSTDDVIDQHLFKPLNQERVFEMIVNMYDIKVPAYTEEEKKEESAKGPVQKTHIIEAKDITQNSFKDFSGKNLLIVEDNIINQKVLLNLLHLSEMNISVANNGREAVDLIQSGSVQFDLVLMDINMPIMDGYTATQMIRQDTQFDALPIVAFTALVLDSEVEKMFNCGLNAFLPKPLNIGKLYTAFDTYMASSTKATEKTKEVEPEEEVAYQGIDIKEGIRHAHNSKALYLEVLKEFSTAYSSSDEIFTKLVQEHRYEQVKMLCVDMRGLTGSIGAQDMHTLMTELLQQLLYKKYDLLVNYQERYRSELEALNRSIDQYISAA